MARIVQITIPSERTAELTGTFGKLDGLIGMHVERGISVQPPGDVVTIEITNDALHPLLRSLREADIGRDGTSSVTTNEPRSVVSSPNARALERESSEASWEEMDFTLAKEGSMTVNGLLMMAASGLIAAVGVSTGSVHLVAGAAIIAPGFAPITRCALGIVARSGVWRIALLDLLKAYTALVAAAAAGALLLEAAGHSPLDGKGTYLLPSELFNYWTSFTLPSLLVSTAAGVAGAVLIAADRSVLTAGVLVALSLIPAASIAGVALVMGDLETASLGALRWLADVVLVILTSLVILTWDRVRTQRRTAFV